MSDDTYVFTYECDDGYVGGSRPQKCTVYLQDFVDLDDVKEELYQAATDHMNEHIGPAIDQDEIDRFREAVKRYKESQ